MDVVIVGVTGNVCSGPTEQVLMAGIPDALNVDIRINVVVKVRDLRPAHRRRHNKHRVRRVELKVQAVKVGRGCCVSDSEGHNLRREKRQSLRAECNPINCVGREIDDTVHHFDRGLRGHCAVESSSCVTEVTTILEEIQHRGRAELCAVYDGSAIEVLVLDLAIVLELQRDWTS